MVLFLFAIFEPFKFERCLINPHSIIFYQVLGKGLFDGHISLVFERFLGSSTRAWCLEGDIATGKSCFFKKICLQGEVYHPDKLLVLITPDKLKENKDDNTDAVPKNVSLHDISEILPLLEENSMSKDLVIRSVEAFNRHK